MMMDNGMMINSGNMDTKDMPMKKMPIGQSDIEKHIQQMKDVMNACSESCSGAD